MHKILVIWKYFGFGDKKENIERLFLKYNCVGELLSLKEAIPKLEEFEGISLELIKLLQNYKTNIKI